MSYGFVYLWRDKKKNRYYVGSHWGSEDDGYVCSSSWMKSAYKSRPEDFKRRILSRVYTTRKELLSEELRYLFMIKPEEIKVRYYNLNIRSNNHWIAGDSPQTVAQKSGNARRGSIRGPMTEERKKNISNAKLGWNVSEDTKAKMSEAAKLRKASEETKQKLSDAQKLRHQEHTHYTQKPDWIPKPKKVHQTLYCQICQEPTNSHRRKFCDLHRYKGMNLTRATKEGSKWHQEK